MVNLPLALTGGLVAIFLFLGGLLTLTFLNMVAVPDLFLRFGDREALVTGKRW